MGVDAVGVSSRSAAQRSRTRTVALPAEHGGWGLTLEPGLLGLLVAPSAAGVALAAAGLVAFVARTPLKVVLVDRWRCRRLDRTVLAEKVAAGELVVLAGLLAIASLTAQGPFWVPLALAAPVLAVELWFDMRSKSRRLAPEIAGAAGIGSVAAAIVLADAGGARLAAGLWLVVAARALASVPFVRFQLARTKRRTHPVRGSDAAQAASLMLAAVAVAADGQLLFGLAAIALVGAVHLVAARRPPPLSAAVLGIQQTVLGALVVLTTALGTAIL